MVSVILCKGISEISHYYANKQYNEITKKIKYVVYSNNTHYFSLRYYSITVDIDLKQIYRHILYESDEHKSDQRVVLLFSPNDITSIFQ